MIFYVPELKNAGAWIEYKGNGSRSWRGLRDPAKVTDVVFHHTVTNPLNDWKKEVEYIRHIHMNVRKWDGIGYNIVISSEEANGYAKAVLIGDLASIRAHTPNLKGSYGYRAGYGNVYLIGVSFVGQLHKYNPTKAQIRTAHAIAKELIFNENKRFPLLKDWGNIKSHKNFDSTTCSGNWDWQKNAIINVSKETKESKPEESSGKENNDVLYRIMIDDNQYGKEILDKKDAENAFTNAVKEAKNISLIKKEDIMVKLMQQSNTINSEVVEYENVSLSNYKVIHNKEVKFSGTDEGKAVKQYYDIRFSEQMKRGDLLQLTKDNDILYSYKNEVSTNDKVKNLSDHIKSGGKYSATSAAVAFNVGLIVMGVFPELNEMAVIGISNLSGLITNMIMIILLKNNQTE